ncbi:hypothetical protein [Spongiactinospora rosea]|uniref:hypothetical protein n=1 Tax=Spongiactinospora rosea TaxID=2248750 RepID=UPI0011C07657|nr:hypothetical protein [Spongiactinospora rosea]
MPLPRRFGIGPIRVTGVEDDTITMVVPLTRSKFESDGGCSATLIGSSADAPAHWDLTCRSAEKVTINQMTLTVTDITDKAAIIRIRPAK